MVEVVGAICDDASCLERLDAFLVHTEYLGSLHINFSDFAQFPVEFFLRWHQFRFDAVAVYVFIDCFLETGPPGTGIRSCASPRRRSVAQIENLCCPEQRRSACRGSQPVSQQDSQPVRERDSQPASSQQDSQQDSQPERETERGSGALTSHIRLVRSCR